jgi:CheY-like chemotaxis protein
MTILLVEDDDLLGAELVSTFTNKHPNIQVRRLSIERAFREELAELERSPPDLIIMDVMLPWDFPRPDVTLPPDDVVSGGFRIAGVRLYELLQRSSALAAIPVIFHSVSDTGLLRQSLGARPPHVLILPKTSASAEELLLYTRSLLPEHDYGVPPPKNWWHRLFDALELKPGAFGFRVDLKRIPTR